MRCCLGPDQFFSDRPGVALRRLITMAQTDVKRATRIDKDVKTTQRHSRLFSFLYDLMWSYRYFPQLALLLLLVDGITSYLVIQYVPCELLAFACPACLNMGLN